jgi:hypothetical protein
MFYYIECSGKSHKQRVLNRCPLWAYRCWSIKCSAVDAKTLSLRVSELVSTPLKNSRIYIVEVQQVMIRCYDADYELQYEGPADEATLGKLGISLVTDYELTAGSSTNQVTSKPMTADPVYPPRNLCKLESPDPEMATGSVGNSLSRNVDGIEKKGVLADFQFEFDCLSNSSIGIPPDIGEYDVPLDDLITYNIDNFEHELYHFMVRQITDSGFSFSCDVLRIQDIGVLISARQNKGRILFFGHGEVQSDQDETNVPSILKGRTERGVDYKFKEPICRHDTRTSRSKSFSFSRTHQDLSFHYYAPHGYSIDPKGYGDAYDYKCIEKCVTDAMLGDLVTYKEQGIDEDLSLSLHEHMNSKSFMCALLPLVKNCKCDVLVITQRTTLDIVATRLSKHCDLIQGEPTWFLKQKDYKKYFCFCCRANFNIDYLMRAQKKNTDETTSKFGGGSRIEAARDMGAPNPLVQAIIKQGGGVGHKPLKRFITAQKPMSKAGGLTSVMNKHNNTQNKLPETYQYSPVFKGPCPHCKCIISGTQVCVQLSGTNYAICPSCHKQFNV